jgi:hypothetical protein
MRLESLPHRVVRSRPDITLSAGDLAIMHKIARGTASDAELARYYSRGNYSPNWGRPNDATWMANKYKDAIRKNFDYDNLADAKIAAAKKGVPIVMFFGSSDTPGTRHLAERAIHAYKRLMGSKAIFVYLDTNKDAPNRGWVLGGKYPSVCTRVAWVPATRDGKVAPLKDIGGSWGVGWDAAGHTSDRVSQALRLAQREKGKFKDLPEYKLDRINLVGMRTARDQVRRFTAEAHKDEARASYASAAVEYRRAMASADRFTIGQLTKEIQRAEREREKEAKKSKPSAAKLDAFGATKEIAQELIAAKADSRYNIGLTYGHSKLAAKKEEGKEMILQAGRRNPELFAATALPALKAAMLKHGYNDKDYDEVVEKSKKPQYGKLVDDAPLIKPRIIRDLSRLSPKTETFGKKALDVEARYPFSSDRAGGDAKSLLSAVRKAASGRNPVPIVFEVGMNNCVPCKEMESETMSTVRREFGKQTLFAYLNASKSEGQKLAAAMIKERGGSLSAPGTILATVRAFKPGVDDARNPLRIGDYVIVPEKWIPGKQSLPKMKGILKEALPPATKKMQSRWADWIVSTRDPSKEGDSNERHLLFFDEDIYSSEALRA